ncbi:MAG: hypothetical protein BGO49_14585 [Planctomycetales bacterium 71-10]|nr:MAG: hypothetical protein BGO49_14585 [Planctomycetales bacterium 71-10]
MSYEIKLTRRALDDLDRLAGESRAEIDHLTRRFFEALARLEAMPLSCGLAYEDRLFREEIRHLLFKVHKGRSFRALFSIRGDAVWVLAVRGPGERPIRPEDLDD